MRLQQYLGVLSVLVTLAAAAPASAQDPEGRTAVRMKGMDANGDGAVSLEEFTEYRRGWSAKRDDAATKMRPEVIKKAFDRIDTDRDGRISFVELLENTKAIQARK